MAWVVQFVYMHCAHVKKLDNIWKPKKNYVKRIFPQIEMCTHVNTEHSKNVQVKEFWNNFTQQQQRQQKENWQADIKEEEKIRTSLWN